MLAYTAPSPLGPFTRSPKNVNFLNGSCYYSRESSSLPLPSPRTVNPPGVRTCNPLESYKGGWGNPL